MHGIFETTRESRSKIALFGSLKTSVRVVGDSYIGRKLRSGSYSCEGGTGQLDGKRLLLRDDRVTLSRSRVTRCLQIANFVSERVAKP